MMMPLKQRFGVAMVSGVALAAALAATAWAFAPARGSFGAAINSATGSVLTQFGVFTIVPIDSQQAFVEGYQAYQAHDQMKAIERFTLAADKYPALADYALYFLGCAQRELGDSEAAAGAFERVVDGYPQSVFAQQAALGYAQAEFRLGRFVVARGAAARLAAGNPDPDVEQQARLVEARATLAMGEARSAYDQLQAIREKYPRGAADDDARAMAYSIVAQRPELIDARSLGYHRGEAELLLREGQSAMAYDQAEAALALSPPALMYAELLWLKGRALRMYPDRESAALVAYLKFAPRGEMAAEALDRRGHLYWRRNDTAAARTMFAGVVSRFPENRLAAEAMFDAGRTHEDDGDWMLARAEYLRLIAQYHRSASAAEARFRAPFALYMTGHFAQAAREFAAMMRATDAADERDMFSYWHARALERDGAPGVARPLYEQLAQSVGSNYYPSLAARRLGASAGQPAVLNAPELDGASAPDLGGPFAFHLGRVTTLSRLGLTALEPPELRALAAEGMTDRPLRNFVLAELQRTGAWHDAIELAMRLEKNGSLDSATSERVRYPLAYWDLIEPASTGAALDPFLVVALVRQESLFNPQARSVSDARGLMQLLPATAARWSPAAGVVPVSLNLYDPTLSVRLGTVYLKNLFGMFGGDPFKAVAAYNAGEHAVLQWNAKFPGDDDQWVENIGFYETRNYVKRVLGGLREYRILYPSRASSGGVAQQPPQF